MHFLGNYIAIQAEPEIYSIAQESDDGAPQHTHTHTLNFPSSPRCPSPVSVGGWIASNEV